MRKAVNFTATVLHAVAPPRQGRLSVRDPKTPGLLLEVTPAGAKSFYLYRRIKNRPTRVRLGAFPAMTVEQARGEVAKLNGAIAAGADPSSSKRALRGELTLQELFDVYLEVHAKPHKRTWKADIRNLDLYLAIWKPRPLSSIRHADVQAWHARTGKKHGLYTANRALALLSKVFNTAAPDSLPVGNPCRGVQKFREQSRDRFLSGAELAAFLPSVEAEPDETFRDFFKLALFTGARRGNVQAMRWVDLNLKAGVWRVPGEKSKNGDPLQIVLCAPAVEILRQRKAATRGEWVLPSWGATGHLIEVKAAWKRIVKRAGLSNLRIHDLRRTMGSWQAATGATTAIIGKSLGHKSPSSTAVYARLDLDPVRLAVEKAVGAMLAAGKDGSVDHDS